VIKPLGGAHAERKQRVKTVDNSTNEKVSITVNRT
jgi:hypothetical protein